MADQKVEEQNVDNDAVEPGKGGDIVDVVKDGQAAGDDHAGDARRLPEAGHRDDVGIGRDAQRPEPEYGEREEADRRHRRGQTRRDPRRRGAAGV